MSTEYKEGDLVEAERQEGASSTRMRGAVTKAPYLGDGMFFLKAQSYEPSMAWLERAGFTITVIERAPEPLPTEQGVYASTRTDCGPDLRPYHLDGRGVWHELDDNGPIVVTRADVAEFAPLKRLDVTT